MYFSNSFKKTLGKLQINKLVSFIVKYLIKLGELNSANPYN